jgi:hypothetical protein
VNGNTLSTTFPASTITLLVVSSTTVVAQPDGGSPDGGTSDGGSSGDPGTSAASSTVQGLACTSAPGLTGGGPDSLALLGLLLLALSRLHGQASKPRRPRRE